MKTLNIAEFESIMTTRLLARRDWQTGGFREEYDIEELQKMAIWLANDIFKELSYTDLYVRKTGAHVFIFYQPNRRILGEIVMDGIYSGKKVRQPSFKVSARHGLIGPNETFGEIIKSVASLPRFKKSKGGK